MTIAVVVCAMVAGYILGQYKPVRTVRARARTVAQRDTSTTADRVMFLLLHPLGGWRILRSRAS